MCVLLSVFVKQKTAYEMRISDWSSDVCSSDLTLTNGVFAAGEIETSVEAEAGEVVHAVVLFAANDDGSQLLCYIVEGLPSQLPMTLLAGKAYVPWYDYGIFRIDRKRDVYGKSVSVSVALVVRRLIKKIKTVSNTVRVRIEVN